MADIQIKGKFNNVGYDPKTWLIKFRAKLTSAPSDQWVAVFREFQAVERSVGNTFAVASVQGDVVEFAVQEVLARATADVIRRCIDKTNPQAKKRQAQEQAHSQTQQKVVDDERRRIDEKFRDGI